MSRSGSSCRFSRGRRSQIGCAAAGPMPFRDAATLVARLAEAVQLAHEQGLVHGDLKP